MPPGSAELLQPRGDVDPVAVDVVALDHHVAEIDADAQYDTRGRPVSPALRSAMPRCTAHGALDGVDDAAEFGEQRRRPSA